VSGPTICTTGHRIASQEQFAAWGAAWVRRIAALAPKEIRFGGALGWDSLALRMADAYFLGSPARPRLVVYCANRVVDLPTEAAQAVSRIGPDLVELRLVDAGAAWPEALLRRNVAMLVGGRMEAGKPVAGAPADVLLAAWDGRSGGGTAHCRGEAVRRGIRVDALGGGR
jgi:hypothetical protein